MSAVFSPSHYTQGGIEVMDFIHAKNLNYSRGNAIKYICRAGFKDPNKEIEDLEKAIHSLQREIERVRKVNETKEALRNQAGGDQ
jgi:hypothetical protein